MACDNERVPDIGCFQPPSKAPSPLVDNSLVGVQLSVMRGWRWGLVVVTSVLVACSGTSAKSEVRTDAGSVLVRASASIDDVDGFRFRIEDSLAGGALSQVVEGAVDGQRNRLGATTTFRFAPKGETSREDPGFRDLIDNPTEFVLDSDRYYMRGGAALARRDPPLPGVNAEQWYVADLAALGADGSEGVSALSPAKLAARLRAVGSSPTSIGRDKIDGVPVTQWRVSLTLKELSTLPSDGGSSPNLDEKKTDQAVFNLKAINFDLWIEDNGRLRRLHQWVDVEAVLSELRRNLPPATTRSLSSLRDTSLKDINLSDFFDPNELLEDLVRSSLDMSTKWEFFDFGKSVNVAVPNGAIDITERLRAARK